MIRFFTEGVAFSVPRPRLTKRWLLEVAQQEGVTLNALSYIFCSDDYLHQINVDFLDHDTLTDVITFDYSEDAAQIEGEIYVSVDRIRENAQEIGVPFEKELKRVMVHGLLHLGGYTDKNSKSKNKMTLRENFHLGIHFRE